MRFVILYYVDHSLRTRDADEATLLAVLRAIVSDGGYDLTIEVTA